MMGKKCIKESTKTRWSHAIQGMEKEKSSISMEKQGRLKVCIKMENATEWEFAIKTDSPQVENCLYWVFHLKNI